MDYVLIGLIIGICVLLVAIFSKIFRAGQWSKDIENKLKDIEKGLERIENNVNLLLLINRDKIIDYYRKQSPKLSNPTPISPDKDKLLKKLMEGTINRDEALHLRDILEEEKKKAEMMNAIGAVLAIIGLIALIKIILDMFEE